MSRPRKKLIRRRSRQPLSTMLAQRLRVTAKSRRPLPTMVPTRSPNFPRKSRKSSRAPKPRARGPARSPRTVGQCHGVRRGHAGPLHLSFPHPPVRIKPPAGILGSLFFSLIATIQYFAASFCPLPLNSVSHRIASKGMGDANCIILSRWSHGGFFCLARISIRFFLSIQLPFSPLLWRG